MRVASVVFFVLLLFWVSLSPMHAQVNKFQTPSLLPDSPFYFVVSITEQIKVFLSPGGPAKAEQDMSSANTRLAEVHELLKKQKPSVAVSVLPKFEALVNRVVGRLERETGRGLDTDQTIAIISEHIFSQHMTLADEYIMAPEQTKPAFLQTMQLSVDAYKKALGYLAPDRKQNIRINTQKKKERALDYFTILRNDGNEVPYLPLETSKEDL